MASMNIATKNSVITKSTGRDQPKTVDEVLQGLTEKWTVAISKNNTTLREISAVLKEAHSSLDKDTYVTWLKNVARMSEGTASKHRSIATCGILAKDEYANLLPPDWTVWYQMSRFSNCEDLTPTQALKSFKDALKFVRTEAPTVADLTTKVNELLGRTPQHPAAAVDPILEKTALDMTGKSFSKLTPEVQTKVRDFAAVHQQQATAAEASRPDPLTGQPVTHEATAPLGDPTPAEIADTVETEFASDDNDVEIAQFNQALNEVRLRNAIRTALKAEGLHGVIVTVAPKLMGASA
jgi:hypothetical protein